MASFVVGASCTPAPMLSGGFVACAPPRLGPADRWGTQRNIPASMMGEVPAQLRRRRAASWRCPPLQSEYRDPLDQLNQREGPISTRELDSWRVAWAHLTQHGYPAIIPRDVLLAARQRAS
jgi:hypothetical protein